MNEVEAMREFFNKILDQFHNLTGTAQKVAELEQNIQALNDRLNALEQQNAQLQRDLAQANDMVRQAQVESQQHRDAATGANEAIVRLQEAFVKADSRVADLSRQITDEVDRHRVTKADLDDARKSAQEWEAQYVSTRGQIDSAFADRDQARSRAAELEGMVNDLQSKLNRLTAILNPNISAAAE